MRVTLLLFLSLFFNVITCVDVLPARKRSFHDIAVERRALIKWDPHAVAGRHSKHVALLRSLIVKLEGPERINRAEELTLTTIITNTGSETLMLVNEPSGILYSRRPTKRFYVTHSTGTIPQFKGVQVKFSIRKAIELGDVTSLDPGQSISVSHDLSEAYDFTVFGRYSVEPRNRFFVVNPATKRVTMVQAGSTLGTSVEWSGKLVARDNNIIVANLKSVTQDSIGFFGCSEKQKADLVSETQIVVDHVMEALNYLTEVQQAPQRYITWFGELQDGKPRKAVTKTLNGILTFAYAAKYHCRSGLTCGWALANGHHTIITNWVGICPSFFKSQDENAKVCALISGLSHYNYFTGLRNDKNDKEECVQLAKKHPGKAVKNVASFGYFVMDEQP